MACGLAIGPSLHDVYRYMKSLKHRGREASGIVGVGYDSIDVLKWAGPVEMFDLEDLQKILSRKGHHTFMGHVRYATRGRKEDILDEAHPHVIGGVVDHRGDHIIIENCDVAGVHNGQFDGGFFDEGIEAKVRTGCDTEAALHLYQAIGERGMMERIPGSYTMAIADKRKKDVIIMRGSAAITPGVVGMKDGSHCFASESNAFDENGAKFLEDMYPGSIYYLNSEGGIERVEVVDADINHCFFQWNYLGSIDSRLDSRSVRTIREELGNALARELPPELIHSEGVDLVTFLPRCPEVAARRYARVTETPFEPVFYKKRGDRSFMHSTARERAQSIRTNLEILPQSRREYDLRGKRVVVIDDSVVRGTNLKQARDLLRRAGADPILLSYTPPIGIIGESGERHGCTYGVDMSPNEAFITRTRDGSRNRTPKEINNVAGMPIHYLSYTGMVEAFQRQGIPGSNLCTHCIGGPKPFDVVPIPTRR